MKAQELMIGDWVISKKRGKDEILEVVTIDGGSNIFWLDGDSYSGLVKGDDIFPIPLTPEILEKNFQGTADYFINTADYFIKLERYDRTIEGMDAWFVNIWTKTTFFASVIRYVHELQHALRMCKIEKEIEL